LLRSWAALLPFAAAFALGHSTTLILSAYGLAPEALWFPVLFETVIALSILYLALENIFGAGGAPRAWIAALVFGWAYGFGFSFSLRPTLQFGGTHVLISILSFNAGVELAIVLMLLLLVKAFEFIFRFRAGQRVTTLFLAGLAAHTAWHRMLDRAKWLSSFQPQWPAIDPAGLTTTKILVAVAAILGVSVLLVRTARRWENTS
jgi:hypothetical protein